MCYLCMLINLSSKNCSTSSLFTRQLTCVGTENQNKEHAMDDGNDTEIIPVYA